MGARIAFLMWRDTTHPEGGGSELFIERLAEWLVARGHEVTIVCAAHDRAPQDDERNGVRYRRRGGRFGVYPQGLAYLLTRAGRATDIVVDVQNGLPFWSALLRPRKRVVVIVNHNHRAQWQMMFPTPFARVGSWLETRAAPRVYRSRQYVTISEASRLDLLAQGITDDRVQVVICGIDLPTAVPSAPAPDPTMCVVGRLVPHKRIEDALHVLASLRADVPGLRLDVVGDGWWREQLEATAAELGVTDAVTFHGFVTPQERDRLIAASWLLLMPSAKEGWGLVIVEAAALGVPAIAYRGAGGVAESIVDGVTGVLVDDLAGLTEQCGALLTDPVRRASLAAAARERALTFSWDGTGKTFAGALGLADEEPVEATG